MFFMQFNFDLKFKAQGHFFVIKNIFDSYYVAGNILNSISMDFEIKAIKHYHSLKI